MNNSCLYKQRVIAPPRPQQKKVCAVPPLVPSRGRSPLTFVISPNESLSYTWNFAHSDPALDVESVVTFSLVPIGKGTPLRMEQSGFRLERKQASGGARIGWQQFFEELEQLLERDG